MARAKFYPCKVERYRCGVRGTGRKSHAIAV